jgi:transposase-like protein
VWHGKYTRKLVTLGRIYQIPIKRLLCTVCNHTFSLLPEFVRKYCRYGADIISLVVREIRKQLSVSQILDRLGSFEIYLEYPTVYRWKKKFQPVRNSLYNARFM